MDWLANAHLHLTSVLFIYIHQSFFLDIFIASKKSFYKIGYMKIIAVPNQKGGCGKTTTVMNLAGGFTKIGYRVLVVDADPQASATVWSLAKGQGSLPFDVLTARLLRHDFGRIYEMEYDLALIDCPPGIVGADAGDAFKFTRVALRDSDLILVPLMPSSLDFSAARTFVRYLAAEKSAETKVAVLLNAMQRTRLSSQAELLAADIFAPIGGIVLQSTIGRRVSITEVCGLGKTIFDLPASSATHEYTSLAKEILQCLSSHPLSSPTISPTISSPSTSNSAPAEPGQYPPDNDPRWTIPRQTT